MEIQAAPNQVEALDLDEYISVVSSLSPLPSLPSTGGSNENITRIHRDLYSAAVKVNYLEFINIQNLESLRTPNKNTVLHIHLTSTTSETTQTRETKPVSEEFVTRILETCEGLVLVPNAKGETLLHIAARYGHSNIAKLLVERVKAFPRDIESGIGAEKKFIRATNNEKDTALHEAVRYHHIEVVKTLLEMDPDYSYCANTANETPLYLASERRYQQVVAEILNKVKSPAYDGPNNRTALHAAVINKDIEIARYLLQNEHVKVAVRQADKKGCIPLHYAVKIGNKNMTKLLLESDETNSTAYMQDNEGRTALHIAAYADHCSILEMIIKIFPDCSELVDNKGRNALHYAVDGGRWFAVNKIMRNPSLSNLYNEKDVEGNTPLHLCTNNPILASRLVNHRRVDKQAVNKKDQTALDVAYDNIEGSTVSKLNLITVLEGAGAKRSQRLVDESKNGQEKGDGLVFTKEAKESHLIVATLIATVSFAAGITLPGGNIQDGEHKGSPILGQRASFKAFIVLNTISMVLAACATFIHLVSPLNKAKWKDRYLSEIAFSFTLIAVATMIVAFATGTYAVLGSSSVGITVIIIGLSFFHVFRKIMKLNFEGKFVLMFMKYLLNVIMFSVIPPAVWKAFPRL